MAQIAATGGMSADSTAAGRMPSDSVATDSIATDSVVHHKAIMISPAEQLYTPQMRPAAKLYTESWLLLGLLILMVAIGLKFRNSTSYLSMLAKELLTTRRRHNVFDDTVRETSFLLLLNTVTLLSGGVLLYFGIAGTEGSLEGAAACMGLGLTYGVFMWLAYRVTGWTFARGGMMEVWLRGHSAAQGLLSIALLPLGLAVTAEPELAEPLGIAALSLFGISKLLFIYKGARIFIHNFTSFILFFYYLCSLEIVPLILSYAAALYLNGHIR